MNHEVYVTYEQSKILKELGFDWECRECYNNSGIFKESFDRWDYNHVADYLNVACSAPTLNQAQKWLRECKGIILLVSNSVDVENTSLWYWYITDEQGWNKDSSPAEYETYEKALSVGINRGLELLKDKIS